MVKTQQVPACPDGFVWCPNTKKCIPAEQQRSGGRGRGQGRGQGKGPMGVPTREEKAEELINLIFDEGFEIYSKSKVVEKKIDMLLDANIEECGGPLVAEEGEDGFVGSKYDDDAPAEEEQPKKKQNKINTIPNQDAASQYSDIRDELGEAASLAWGCYNEMLFNEDYKTFFKSLLNKYGYDSPADIPTEKRKEFFNAVDKGWKSTKEGATKKVVKENDYEASLRADLAKAKKWAKQNCGRIEVPEKKKKCLDKAAKKIVYINKKLGLLKEALEKGVSEGPIDWNKRRKLNQKFYAADKMWCHKQFNNDQEKLHVCLNQAEEKNEKRKRSTSKPVYISDR